MSENAKSWIAEKDDRPFFLYWCSTDPHRSGATGFGNSPKDDNFPGVAPTRFKADAMRVPSWLPNAPEVRQEWAEFYEAINRLDQGVGTLMQALKDTGHWDDTLVLFLADNGPPFPGAKTTLYDPGARLPLIVRDPTQPRATGVSLARTTDALAAWVDITPTILDWCGVTPKPSAACRPARERRLFRGSTSRQECEDAASHVSRPLVFESSHRRARREERLWRDLRLAHVPRDHDVLPDAFGDQRSTQADLQHRSRAAVPVRLRPVRLADVADGGSKPSCRSTACDRRRPTFTVHVLNSTTSKPIPTS